MNNRWMNPRKTAGCYHARLTIAGESALQIEESRGLRRLTTARYLIGLEGVGLLERSEGLSCTLKVLPPFGFKPGSKVVSQQQEDFMKRVSNQVTLVEPGAFSLMKPPSLTRGLLEEMKKEINDTLDRYSCFSAGRERGSASRG